jgi:hypothetical protein
MSIGVSKRQRLHKIIRIAGKAPRADTSAPTEGGVMVFICIIGPYGRQDDGVLSHYLAQKKVNTWTTTMMA